MDVKSGWTCQVRREWKHGQEHRGPETGRGRLKIWIIVIFGSLSFFDFFLWVEHVWSSGRVRRQRDVNKLNMSKMIRMWIERGKRDGKGENIKGNALLADFTHFLTLAYS